MKLVNLDKNESFSINESIWISPNGNLLDIEFDAKFNLEKIKNAYPNLWRYEDAIAIDQKEGIVSLNEGFTPIEKIKLNKKEVYIKHEQLFSTGSYKDRGATTLISKAKQLGIKKIVQDSSGNAGCAIAAYAAKAQISCEIYLPENTSNSKISQMLAYGATINKIKGDRNDTSIAAWEAAKSTYYASHCYNPWFFEGTKTFAFEVCEQLGWKSPDSLVLPAGNGTLIIGCYIGFSQLLKAGIINKMPKIIAIQTAVCSPLFDNFYNIKNNKYSSNTIAEGIAIQNAPRAKQILNAVKATSGIFIKVNDTETKNAWIKIASMGNYIEPTSAATIAGLEKYIVGSFDETIVSLFSGHGLKSKSLIEQI
ncbi:MAG: threonine synthase [Bacteroidia bacterium]|nr:threonine synthase [Bacteroidia bacterium]